MGNNILIVDDAAFMRMMVKDILTKGGYNVVGLSLIHISYMENFDCDMERVKEYKTNRHVFLRVTKESDA